MRKVKKYKVNYCRYPANNLRKMHGMTMVRHCGKKHKEKWRDNEMPF